MKVKVSTKGPKNRCKMNYPEEHQTNPKGTKTNSKKRQNVSKGHETPTETQMILNRCQITMVIQKSLKVIQHEHKETKHAI